jgi:DNA polymerase-3 subunit epsilon
MKSLIEFVGNSTLVGHHIDLDVEMINAALEKLECGRLKNEALDIDLMHQKLNDVTDKQLSLNQLAEIYKIPNGEPNSSTEDAYKTALLFLKLKSRLGIK